MGILTPLIEVKIVKMCENSLRKLMKSVVFALAGIYATTGAASAASVSNLTASYVENSYFIPFWVVIAFMFAGLSLLAASVVFRDPFQRVIFTILSILCSLAATGSAFVAGDVIQVTDSLYTVILHQSTGILILTTGLAVLGILFLVMYVLSYSGDLNARRT